MEPLAVDGGVAESLFWLCAGGWAVFEVVLAVRASGDGGRDLSVVPLTLSVVAGLALAEVAARLAGGLALPGPRVWPLAVGLVVFGLGLVVRTWAVHELGRFFKYTVVVQSDHRVVDTGPYRRIRHPSYTGLLMAALGLGIALGNWLAIPAALVPPLVAFAIRIRHEEQVLAAELGEPYRAYMRRTRRLIPGVW
jgi:protein-S-isoprenylcysteine O-methyltransferase Ste14